MSAALVREAATRLFARAPDAGALEASGFARLLADGGSHGELVALFIEAGRAAVGEAVEAALLAGVPEHVRPLALAALIAGGLEAALALTLAHVSARVQFGKALAKQQAVQQALADFACEVAAVAAAAHGAAAVIDSGQDAAFEVAAARLWAGQAVPRGTAVAHQLHGAIGFTADYPLHRHSVDLNRWRRTGGSDADWAARVGAMVTGDWWADMTARSDRSMEHG
ncbi:acyl-CoA dehydrogenase family protein [Sandaracinobacteroides saxicola]|uniref:Acyl-CoA dehydrogenase/oxidase C-terminal domain-containing protein n=1 Tax=Sandaracinobacteroides saxicola TaxID=2759707 RepID=A0A7G5IG76_9SPHN|nr:acyl-CoA dehydrogenase family protein [Sandaracinobacteroides saxicola]QMW22368.1 hypothetical protein H3309_13585 [Sandaracinobacteroides saxicola]